MSRTGVERACFSLRNSEHLAAFRRDHEAYLREFSLTQTERDAIAAGEVGILFALGVVTGALEILAAVFHQDNEAYVRKLRVATGRSVNGEQIELLRRRAAAKRAKING